MIEVSVYSAKAQLSRLLDRAAEGEEVVITRHGKPVARLLSMKRREGRRKLGLLKGRIRVAADFDAPLPEQILRAFEGRGT